VRVRGPIPTLIAIALAVGACGGSAVPADDPSAGVPPPADTGSGPTGVLLWLHDGARTWPPHLWALPLDGGETARVDLPIVEDAIDWDWAPDLSRIVWLEDIQDGVPAARLVMGDPDGSSPTVIGELRNRDDYRGRAWSHDASRFAYAAYTDAGSTLTVVDAASGTSTEIESWADPVPVDVDWAPDGSGLVVGVAGDGAKAGVFTFAADGSDDRRLSERGAWRVRWSPDGSAIAFESSDHPGPTGIYLVAADGSGEHRVSPPDVVEMGPVWSPDGAWIAFASERDAEGLPVAGEARHQPLIDAGIYLMRPDGSDVRRLVEPVESGWVETWDWFASWPPGGG